MTPPPGQAPRPPAAPSPGRRVMALPGFVGDTEIGLGDAIGRVAAAVGIRPCGGCARRGAALNNWLSFAPRRR